MPTFVILLRFVEMLVCFNLTVFWGKTHQPSTMYEYFWCYLESLILSLASGRRHQSS